VPPKTQNGDDLSCRRRYSMVHNMLTSAEYGTRGLGVPDDNSCFQVSQFSGAGLLVVIACLLSWTCSILKFIFTKPSIQLFLNLSYVDITVIHHQRRLAPSATAAARNSFQIRSRLFTGGALHRQPRRPPSLSQTLYYPFQLPYTLLELGVVCGCEPRLLGGCRP